jgi:flagellar basal body-associated protein FliL
MFGLMEEVDTTIPDALATRTSEIRDIVQTLLRNQTSESLRGSNLELFRAELVSRINSLLPPPYVIYRVLLPDIIIT